MKGPGHRECSGIDMHYDGLHLAAGLKESLGCAEADELIGRGDKLEALLSVSFALGYSFHDGWMVAAEIHKEVCDPGGLKGLEHG